MGALTSSGARKASEIVLLIFRVVQLSRPAMLSVVAAGSAMSSSSQRRPRAIDATRIARFSERMGRVSGGGPASGMRTSRRRVDGVLCHGTSITLRLGFRLGSAPFGLASSMTNWSDWTSIRTT
jgi:hypothetical protein